MSVEADCRDRDQGRCVRHGGQLTRGSHCHHRKLAKQGGPDAPHNRITLCPDCHEWCHRNRREARDNGWIVSPSADPAGVPVKYHANVLAMFGLAELATGGLVLLNDEYEVFPYAPAV